MYLWVENIYKLKINRYGSQTKAGLENQYFVSNMLIDMYGKFVFLQYAWRIFSNQPIQDIVTWNAMMAGYIEHGHFDGVWIVLTDEA